MMRDCIILLSVVCGSWGKWQKLLTKLDVGWVGTFLVYEYYIIYQIGGWNLATFFTNVWHVIGLVIQERKAYLS